MGGHSLLPMKVNSLCTYFQGCPQKATNLSFGGFISMDSTKPKASTITILSFAVSPALYDRLGRWATALRFLHLYVIAFLNLVLGSKSSKESEQEKVIEIVKTKKLVDSLSRKFITKCSRYMNFFVPGCALSMSSRELKPLTEPALTFCFEFPSTPSAHLVSVHERINAVVS